MATAYRQVSLIRLFPDEAERDIKYAQKVDFDKQYEVAVQQLSGAFYSKKRTVGVSKQEEKEYQEKKLWCWNLYQVTAVNAGLWQEYDDKEDKKEE